MAYQTINPFNEEVLATFQEQSDDQMMSALQAADKRFRSPWTTGPLEVRTAVLKKASQLMTERSEMLAGLITLEMGKLIAESRAEVALTAAIFNYYADHAAEFLAPRKIQSAVGEAWVEYDPIGVLVGVEPWNYPYYQLVRFAAPNIAIGNTVMVKHAPGVPQCALAFAELLADAGAPAGVYTNLFVSNDQVTKLIDDIRVQGVALTGSDRAGVSLASQAGKNLKKSTMELGGNDPLIVLEDADVKAAARFAVQGRMSNTGQVCIGSKRFIVVEAIADEFLKAVTAAMKTYVPGDPMDQKTIMGPMSSKNALDLLVGQVNDAVKAGAKLLMGGKAIERKGFFMEPTVLTDITQANPASHQEFFGPVAQVYRVKDADEAVTIANDSPFGLGSSVFTSNVDRARLVAKQLQAGMVFINGLASSSPELPFGGVKNSGYGRELSSQGIHEFVNLKTVCIVKPATVPSQGEPL